MAHMDEQHHWEAYFNLHEDSIDKESIQSTRTPSYVDLNKTILPEANQRPAPGDNLHQLDDAMEDVLVLEQAILSFPREQDSEESGYVDPQQLQLDWVADNVPTGTDQEFGMDTDMIMAEDVPFSDSWLQDFTSEEHIDEDGIRYIPHPSDELLCSKTLVQEIDHDYPHNLTNQITQKVPGVPDQPQKSVVGIVSFEYLFPREEPWSLLDNNEELDFILSSQLQQARFSDDDYMPLNFDIFDTVPWSPENSEECDTTVIDQNNVRSLKSSTHTLFEDTPYNLESS